jgi:hypothetical protein
MKQLIFALMLTMLSFPALAAEKSAFMPKPPEVNNYVKAGMPYGHATLHKLFMKIYETSLWTDARRWSMNSTFALCIRYEMNFSAKALVKRTFEEMERAGPVSKEEKQAYGAKLAQLFHDVHPGDVITAVFVPKKGAVFYYNGQKRGVLADIAFAKRFFNIWLGPYTSEPALRDRLLAEK